MSLVLIVLPQGAQMENYRQIRVQIHVGRSQSFVAVVAQVVQGGRRHDRLLHRAPVDLADASTVAAALRVAADELHEAADRL